MADTATQRNLLRKPESGQYNNAWATPLNEDMGSDRVDDALDGRVTFTLSGTKTLTRTNYETDEARMRFIDITSGTGGTVTIPSVEKWYIVRNATSGDVIFTAGGATTATVKSGNTGIVVSDGTSVYPLQTLDFGSSLLKSSGTPSTGSHLTTKTYVDALVASTALSGTVTMGTGVSTFLATPSSANLLAAVTDETGTGSLVFNTAPTFVGTLTTAASATGGAGINLPHGAAPTSPVNGDVWTTTSGLYVRTNGATVGPLIDASGVVSSWTQIGSTVATTSGASVSFTSIPQTYSFLLLEILGVSHDNGANQTLNYELSPDGTTWTTTLALTASAASTTTWYGGVTIPAYSKGAGQLVALVGNLAANNTSVSTLTSATHAWRLSGGVQAIRISPSAGSFDAGSIKLWGR